MDKLNGWNEKVKSIVNSDDEDAGIIYGLISALIVSLTLFYIYYPMKTENFKQEAVERGLAAYEIEFGEKQFKWKEWKK